MPTSDAEGKQIPLDWYRQISPQTVIDIGAGCGTYAQLMRDPWKAGRPDHWLAIEAWQPYLAEYPLIDLYDEILVKDARRLHWPTFAADLVIAGDVLEHMTRDQAQALLKRIKFAAANLIVSIPVLHLPQGAVNGNPYERHIDHWTAADMARELGDGVRAAWIGNVLGYWWWQRE